MRLRCQFGLHKMEWYEEYMPSDEPPDEVWACVWCGTRKDFFSQWTFRFWDWFYETRLGNWLIERDA
jgi:hypothetical protein